jgi:hypothetical protein
MRGRNDRHLRSTTQRALKLNALGVGAHQRPPMPFQLPARDAKQVPRPPGQTSPARPASSISSAHSAATCPSAAGFAEVTPMATALTPVSTAATRHMDFPHFCIYEIRALSAGGFADRRVLL